MPRQKIPEAAARWIRDRLTEGELTHLRQLVDEHGTVDVVLPGPPPHPVDFNEGMRIRNLMRESGVCHDWTDHDFDANWNTATKWALAMPDDPEQPAPSHELIELDDGTVAIHCYRCGLTSYNPNDAANLYCGFCKEWHHDGT